MSERRMNLDDILSFLALTNPKSSVGELAAFLRGMRKAANSSAFGMFDQCKTCGYLHFYQTLARKRNPTYLLKEKTLQYEGRQFLTDLFADATQIVERTELEELIVRALNKERLQTLEDCLELDLFPPATRHCSISNDECYNVFSEDARDCRNCLSSRDNERKKFKQVGNGLFVRSE